MSMDYVKRVYVPSREGSRKKTTYGRMNFWHDYKKPLSRNDRPRYKYVDPEDPIDKGVELKLPTPEKERTFLEERKKAEQSKLDQLLELAQAETGRSPRGSARYLRPIAGGHEPVIANGRIVNPDPMMMSAPVHLGYNRSGGYDDYHKTYLKLQKEGICPSYPLYGPPRLHHGRVGGTWKHVKEVMQAGGSRTVFVDGTPRWLENNKIMNNEVPGSSIMYPLRKKNYLKAFTDPLKIGQETTAYKEAINQTEGGNWNIMR